MNVMEILKARRSVRKFLDEEIPESIVRELAEAASWAPSAGNRQDWLFTFIRDRKLIEALAKKVTERWDGIVAANGSTGVIEDVAA